MLGRGLVLAVVGLSLTAGSASAAQFDWGCNGQSGCAGFYAGAGNETNVVQVTSDGSNSDTWKSNVAINPVPSRMLNVEGYWLNVPGSPIPPYLGYLEEDCTWSPYEATCPDGGWTAGVSLGNGADTVTVRSGDGFDLYGGAGADTIDSRDGHQDFIECGQGADTAIVDSRDIFVRSDCETVEVG